MHIFIKSYCMHFFLLICKKPCELGKDGIPIILISKLGNLRLALISEYGSMLAICALVNS